MLSNFYRIPVLDGRTDGHNCYIITALSLTSVARQKLYSSNCTFKSSFFLLFFRFTRWYVPLSRTSGEACLAGWSRHSLRMGKFIYRFSEEYCYQQQTCWTHVAYWLLAESETKHCSRWMVLTLCGFWPCIARNACRPEGQSSVGVSFSSWPAVRNFVSDNWNPWATGRWRAHKPTIISFDTLPACDGQTDRHAAHAFYI